MKCPKCGNTSFATKESKNNKNSIYYRRRRTCLNCNHVFTTYEVPIEPKGYRVVEQYLG